MSQPLKELFSDEFIDTLAHTIKAKYKKFNVSAFKNDVQDRHWEELELKQRMRRISESLGEYLPNEYSRALDILLPISENFSGLPHMIFPDFVEIFGLDDFDLSMSALAHFTRNSSSEFAIRPFIKTYPQKTMQQMKSWSFSKDKDIRRLASEGCRPRLPWAMALPDFKADPSPVLDIILNMLSDSALYVRRSVANNLNDISKDNAQTVVDIATGYFGENEHANWVLKHACRGMLKGGNKEVLSLFGYSPASHVRIDGLTHDKVVPWSESLNFEFTLSTEKSKKLGKLRVEFEIQFMKADGKLRGKVFKISEGDYVEPSRVIGKRFSFRPISTRKYYSGLHQLSIIVNGERRVSGNFELKEKP